MWNLKICWVCLWITPGEQAFPSPCVVSGSQAPGWESGQHPSVSLVCWDPLWLWHSPWLAFRALSWKRWEAKLQMPACHLSVSWLQVNYFMSLDVGSLKYQRLAIPSAFKSCVANNWEDGHYRGAYHGCSTSLSSLLWGLEEWGSVGGFVS